MNQAVVLFGEAEKGEFHSAYFCETLEHLAHHIGEPPHKEARGIQFAIQMLLFRRPVLFFRVQEEGFHQADYLTGLKKLQKKELFPPIAAIALPGVGDHEIIQATSPICALHESFLILTEQDLYDYLTT